MDQLLGTFEMTETEELLVHLKNIMAQTGPPQMNDYHPKERQLYFQHIAEWQAAKASIARIERRSAEWTKHTPYHWQRTINGKVLDYWPTKNKFRYDNGDTQKGDVRAFIRGLRT